MRIVTPNLNAVIETDSRMDEAIEGSAYTRGANGSRKMRRGINPRVLDAFVLAVWARDFRNHRGN
jgi:hypothetical protein